MYTRHHNHLAWDIPATTFTQNKNVLSYFYVYKYYVNLNMLTYIRNRCYLHTELKECQCIIWLENKQDKIFLNVKATQKIWSKEEVKKFYNAMAKMDPIKHWNWTLRCVIVYVLCKWIPISQLIYHFLKNSIAFA